ncbi:Probable ATP-dependent helicase dinG homolog [Jonesia denitrificans]|nr:Probable ATP-dependent helicase dinG homolog [Jonesia denitrificans]
MNSLLDIVVTSLGGAPRRGQQDMTSAVFDAMEGHHPLIVQAGTGTGKSMAYLVPAVAHAVATNERVIVATATLALQRQIMTRDLPLLSQALQPHLDRQPDVALLKGWSNYVCLHKAQGGYPQEEATLFAPDDPVPAAGTSTADHPDTAEVESLADQMRRIVTWARDTDTGDRDDLVPGVSDRAWRAMSVDKLECIGSSCPLIHECFPDNARKTAFDADLVVTNHTMLGIAASGSAGVLPEHDVIIVDEAHELADRVTSAATVDLSAGSIDKAARLARRRGGRVTDALDDASAQLALALINQPDQTFTGGLPAELHDAVSAVRDASRLLVSELKPEKKDDTADAGLKQAQAAVLSIFEIAERMTAEDTSADVLWCARPRIGSDTAPPRLYAAPLSVSSLLAQALWPEHTAILTSATLAIGGNFDSAARTVGLAGVDDLVTKDVASPFDYPRQGILYLARDLPVPGSSPTTDDQLAHIEELINAAHGRTLGLFSSRKAAQRAAEVLKERVSYPILLQGEDQLPTLVRLFREDPQTCLFGTLSLWQGVDVPGDACQLVVIDRIPFPRPDDPVRSARTKAVAQSGGNGFMTVAAHHAALLLAQGAGRLIRSTDDKGVVAILDPRIATARYGQYLLSALPPMWRTTQKATAVSALHRLTSRSGD